MKTKTKEYQETREFNPTLWMLRKKLLDYYDREGNADLVEFATEKKDKNFNF